MFIFIYLARFFCLFDCLYELLGIIDATFVGLSFGSLVEPHKHFLFGQIHCFEGPFLLFLHIGFPLYSVFGLLTLTERHYLRLFFVMLGFFMIELYSIYAGRLTFL